MMRYIIVLLCVFMRHLLYSPAAHCGPGRPRLHIWGGSVHHECCSEHWAPDLEHLDQTRRNTVISLTAETFTSVPLFNESSMQFHKVVLLKQNCVHAQFGCLCSSILPYLNKDCVLTSQLLFEVNWALCTPFSTLYCMNHYTILHLFESHPILPGFISFINSYMIK